MNRMQKQELNSLRRENVALWWLAIIFFIGCVVLAVVALDQRSRISELRHINDDLSDNATALLERINKQHQYILDRPVVYRTKTVYKELP